MRSRGRDISSELKQDDIDVIEVRVQDEWQNLVGHSVRLDVTAKDTSGKRYNIEVQREAEGVEMGIKQGRAEVIRALLLANTEDNLLHGGQFKELGITQQEIDAAKKQPRS